MFPRLVNMSGCFEGARLLLRNYPNFCSYSSVMAAGSILYKTTTVHDYGEAVVICIQALVQAGVENDYHKMFQILLGTKRRGIIYNWRSIPSFLVTFRGKVWARLQKISKSLTMLLPCSSSVFVARRPGTSEREANSLGLLPLYFYFPKQQPSAGQHLDKEELFSSPWYIVLGYTQLEAFPYPCLYEHLYHLLYHCKRVICRHWSNNVTSLCSL